MGGRSLHRCLGFAVALVFLSSLEVGSKLRWRDSTTTAVRLDLVVVPSPTPMSKPRLTCARHDSRKLLGNTTSIWLNSSLTRSTGIPNNTLEVKTKKARRYAGLVTK